MVQRLEWSSKISVEVPELDEQHRVLFDMINHLVDLVQADRFAQSGRTLVSRLIEYASTHFSDEEAYLLEIAFPQIDAHRHEHDGFVHRLADFSEELDEEGEGLDGAELLEFLTGWVRDHVRNMDMRYVRYARELARGGAPDA